MIKGQPIFGVIYFFYYYYIISFNYILKKWLKRWLKNKVQLIEKRREQQFENLPDHILLVQQENSRRVLVSDKLVARWKNRNFNESLKKKENPK